MNTVKTTLAIIITRFYNNLTPANLKPVPRECLIVFGFSISTVDIGFLILCILARHYPRFIQLGYSLPPQAGSLRSI